MFASRRTFLQSSLLSWAALSSVRAQSPSSPTMISTNSYPWGTFAKRRGQPWDTAGGVTDLVAAGLTAYEPGVDNPAFLDRLGPILSQYPLSMPSIYVNSGLHDAHTSQASIEQVLAIARAAKPLGTRIIVTNPSPIRWGGPEAKTDEQLRHQALQLNRLGTALAELGMTLAYHNHDAELKHGAREFHHMLSATDRQAVAFCLDAHWVYRGCGNSQMALFDVVDRYADRIVELHLRQSTHGVWDEVFALQSDIDYQRLFNILARREIKPLMVLEQAVEVGSPDSMDAIAAHRSSLANLKSALKS